MSDLKTNLQEILQEKQDKIIPENIKKDVQIFDVTGTYEGGGSSGGGDVKLFETVEEMQADENVQEGDLAVVYKEEIRNMAADIQTQYITFPETVVLPEALTSNYYCMLRAIDTSVMFDGNIQLSSTSFRFDGYSEVGMIRVQYTSTDGVNYTRTTFTGDSGDLTNPVDLGTVIGVHSSEEWNDSMGYFMQIEGNMFGGMYEYGNYRKNGLISLPLMTDSYSVISSPSKEITINNSYSNSFNEQDLIDICKEIEASVSSISSNSVSLFMKDDSLYALGYIRTYNGNTYLSSLYNEIGENDSVLPNILVNGGGTSSGTEGEPNFEVKIWKIDMKNKTYSLDTSIQYEISYIKSVTSAGLTAYSTRVTFNEPLDTMCFNQIYSGIDFPYMWKQVSEDDFDQYPVTCDLIYHKDEYQIASNQYTLTSSNQLLPNVSAYGKNGIIVGDDSIYNNIKNSDYLDTWIKPGISLPSTSNINVINNGTSVPSQTLVTKEHVSFEVIDNIANADDCLIRKVIVNTIESDNSDDLTLITNYNSSQYKYKLRTFINDEPHELYIGANWTNDDNGEIVSFQSFYGFAINLFTGKITKRYNATNELSGRTIAWGSGTLKCIGYAKSLDVVCFLFGSSGTGYENGAAVSVITCSSTTNTLYGSPSLNIGGMGQWYFGAYNNSTWDNENECFYVLPHEWGRLTSTKNNHVYKYLAKVTPERSS